jgi:hypothetical protein
MKTGFKDILQPFLIPVIVVVGATIVVYLLLGTKTWENFFPNFLATLLGAIIGIPIAFGISNQQEATKENLQKEKIVPILREELMVDFVHLTSWQKSNIQKLEIVYNSIFLEDSAWSAFSDSGELAFIKDVEILKNISHAYGAVRIVKVSTSQT